MKFLAMVFVLFLTSCSDRYALDENRGPEVKGLQTSQPLKLPPDYLLRAPVPTPKPVSKPAPAPVPMAEVAPIETTVQPIVPPVPVTEEVEAPLPQSFAPPASDALPVPAFENQAAYPTQTPNAPVLPSENGL